MKRKTYLVGFAVMCALMCAAILPASAEDLTGTWELAAMSTVTLTEDGASYSMSDIAILPSTSPGNVFVLHEDATVSAEAQYLEYIPGPLRAGTTWAQAGAQEDVTWLPCLDMSTFQLYTIDDFVDEGTIVCQMPEETVTLQYKIYLVEGKPVMCIQQNAPLEPEGENARTQSTSTFFRKK